MDEHKPPPQGRAFVDRCGDRWAVFVALIGASTTALARLSGPYASRAEAEAACFWWRANGYH